MAARALAPAPARAAEPGSTNRAQPARQAAKTNVPSGGTAKLVRGASSGVVNVASSLFEPSQAIAEEIEKAGPRGLDVRVIAKGLTEEGLIKVRQKGGKGFDSIGLGAMPLLNPWTQKLGGMYLHFEIDNSAIKNGYASFKPRGGERKDWLRSLKENSALLGGLGLKIESLPKPVNKFEEGKLVLGVAGAKVEVGGYVDAKFDLLLENMAAPKISGSADIDIHGALKGKLAFDNPGDVLRGSVTLAVNFKSFSGAVKVAYLSDGTVDISGSAAYNANKLSGEIQFVATDLESANKFAKDALAAAGGKDNVQNAGPPSPVPVPKEGKKKRALAATGRLSFNLTTWFSGTVHVVVDGMGEITVIGKIAPPGEIILFPERSWIKEIVKFEAKAYYGIPVVGNLNLFANISLLAIAKLGPARLHKIEILGTYSTDPAVQKNIEIAGSINISAYGGLRLRAEGGAGIEILAHDLKFGIGLNADVGVKAYADARPTIGYRDPGIFYVSGTLDLVAQPMLGLGGEFFIKLDAPWFSPLSDEKWSWPLFSKEWPLGDPIGISATLKDYVLGSGKVPEIELKPPEFDPTKFMTNMVDDKLPKKSGGAGAGGGTFKEDGSVPKATVKSKVAPTKSGPANTKKKDKSPALSKSSKRDTKAANDAKSTEILKKAARPLTDLKGKGPMTRASLDEGLGKIRKQVSGIDFGVRSSGTKWLINPKAGRMTGKSLEIGAKKEAGASGSGDARAKGLSDDPNERLRLAARAAVPAAKGLKSKGKVSAGTLQSVLGDLKARYALTAIEPFESKGQWMIRMKINPTIVTPSGLYLVETGNAREPEGPNMAPLIAKLAQVIAMFTRWAKLGTAPLAQQMLRATERAREMAQSLGEDQKRGVFGLGPRFKQLGDALVAIEKLDKKYKLVSIGQMTITLNQARRQMPRHRLSPYAVEPPRTVERLKEYTNQLNEQESGINSMVAAEWKMRRATFIIVKRPKEEKKMRATYSRRSKIKGTGKAAPHNPDQSLAGYIDPTGEPAESDVNSHIGSQNRIKAAEIETHINSEIPLPLHECTQLNFELVIK